MICSMAIPVYFVDSLSLFLEDEQTEAILMIGEIGGDAEEKAAAFYSAHPNKKPIAGGKNDGRLDCPSSF